MMWREEEGRVCLEDRKEGAWEKNEYMSRQGCIFFLYL